MNDREIKFRVWDSVGRKWMKLFEVDLLDDQYPNNPEYALQQFTGLRDEDEKEIYEGDIIDCGGDIEEYHEIIFSDGCFMTKAPGDECLIPLYDYNEQCKVVGNIFENPELLKNGNEFIKRTKRKSSWCNSCGST